MNPLWSQARQSVLARVHQDPELAPALKDERRRLLEDTLKDWWAAQVPQAWREALPAPGDPGFWVWPDADTLSPAIAAEWAWWQAQAGPVGAGAGGPKSAEGSKAAARVSKAAAGGPSAAAGGPNAAAAGGASAPGPQPAGVPNPPSPVGTPGAGSNSPPAGAPGVSPAQAGPVGTPGAAGGTPGAPAPGLPPETWARLAAWRDTQVWDHRWTQLRRHVFSAWPEGRGRLKARLDQYDRARRGLKSLLGSPGLGFDAEDGAWERLDWSALEAQAARLEGEPGLRKLAELLGRDYRRRHAPRTKARQATWVWAEEPGRQGYEGYTPRVEAWHDALPSRLARLGDPRLEPLFWKDFLEGHLDGWQTSAPRGRRLQDSPAPPPAPGPLFICLDTSGSMRGLPEQVAKLMTLALVRVCLSQNRPCFLVNFSRDYRCLDLSDQPRQLGALAEFLLSSFHGGTDLAPALRFILDRLGHEAWREADVLVISDFAVPKIPTPLVQRLWALLARSDHRFYALSVSARPFKDVDNIFQQGWSWQVGGSTPGLAPFQIKGI